MPFDVNGTFSRVYDFETDRNNGLKIMAARVDGEFDGIATGLSQTFLRNGAAPMAANLRMGSFSLTGLGDGSLANPSISWANDATSGLYRVGSNQLGVSIAGTKRFQVDTTGASVTGALAVSGNISAANLPGGTIWTSTNDGAGSGLDADLLDGLSGTAFAQIGQANTFTAAPQKIKGAGVGTFDLCDTTGGGGTIRFRDTADAANLMVASVATGGVGRIGADDFRVATASLGTDRLTVDSTAVTFITKLRSSTSIAVPAAASNAQIGYNSVEGAFIIGQGSSRDVSFYNNAGTQKARINAGAEFELLGTPIAPTVATGDNSTSIATTAFVKAQAYAPLASPTFTGTPAAPTASTGDNSTQIATTAFVKAQAYAPLASPTFTGTPAAPTASVGTSTTQLATTAFVQGEKAASIQSTASSATVTPTFTNDAVTITAQAAALTLANWSGTATDFWTMVIRIKDNGTARAISYGTNYLAIDGVTAPTTTVVGKTHELTYTHNSTTGKHMLHSAVTY